MQYKSRVQYQNWRPTKPTTGLRQRDEYLGSISSINIDGARNLKHRLILGLKTTPRHCRASHESVIFINPLLVFFSLHALSVLFLFFFFSFSFFPFPLWKNKTLSSSSLSDLFHYIYIYLHTHISVYIIIARENRQIDRQVDRETGFCFRVFSFLELVKREKENDDGLSLRRQDGGEQWFRVATEQQ